MTTLGLRGEDEGIIWCNKEKNKGDGLLWILGTFHEANVIRRDSHSAKLGLTVIDAVKRLLNPDKSVNTKSKEYIRAKNIWEKSEKDLKKKISEPAPDSRKPNPKDLEVARMKKQKAQSALTVEAKRVIQFAFCPCDTADMNILSKILEEGNGEELSSILKKEVAHQLAVAAEDYNDANSAAKLLHTTYQNLPRLQRKSIFEARPIYAPFLYGRPRRLFQFSQEMRETTNDLIIALRRPEAYVQRHLALAASHTAEYLRNISQKDRCLPPSVKKKALSSTAYLCTPAESVLHSIDAVVRTFSAKLSRATSRVNYCNTHCDDFYLNSSLLGLRAQLEASSTVWDALQDIKTQHDQHDAAIQTATLARDQALRTLRSFTAHDNSIPPLPQALLASREADVQFLTTTITTSVSYDSNVHINSSHHEPQQNLCTLPTATPLPDDISMSIEELAFSHTFRLLQIGNDSCDPATTLFARYIRSEDFVPDWALVFDCQMYNHSIPPTHAIVDEPGILLLRNRSDFSSPFFYIDKDRIKPSL